MIDSPISVSNGECADCELILTDTDKFCPECGGMTALGIATEALRSMGDAPPVDDSKWNILFGNSAQGLPASYPVDANTTYVDPLNQPYTFNVEGNTTGVVVTGDNDEQCDQ